MTSITYREEMRRCGKAACTRCRHGPSHGPYWYAYWRDDDGRLRRRYCGKTKPPEATASGSPTEAGISEGAPALRIRLLGGLEVERGGVPLTDREWPRASARKLLALLVLYPEGLTREEIGEALWPERAPGTAETALRSALWSLRLVLEGPDGADRGRKRIPAESERLPVRQTLVRLHLRPDDWVDIHEFSDAIQTESLDVAALSALVALYRGELLPEFRYEDWTAGARESLRSRWHTLSLHLTRTLAERGEVQAAIERLEAVLSDDGTQEEAARSLMTLLADQGRRHDALQVYRRLVRALETELAVAPDELSSSLAERLGQDAESPRWTAPPPPREVVRRLGERIERHAERAKSPATARLLARLWSQRALALERVGETEEALGNIESGRLVIADYEFPAELSRLLVAEATVYCRQGRAGPAQEAALRAEQLARQAGQMGLVAQALRLQAQAAQQLGQVERAIVLARSSTALYDTMGAREHALQSRRIVALNVWYAGRFSEAEVLYRRNLEEARAVAQPEQEAYVLCGLGATLRARGDLDAAEPHLLEALALATRLEEHFLILSTEYHLANLWADRSDAVLTGDENERARAMTEAERRFRRVMALAQASNSDYMLVFGAIDLAVLLAQWGRGGEAHPLIELASRTLHNLDDSLSPRGWTLLSEAELALSEGDAQRAVARVGTALPLLERASAAALSQAHRVAGIARASLGNPEGAARHWVASLGAAVRCSQRLEELRTRKAMEVSVRRDR